MSAFNSRRNNHQNYYADANRSCAPFAGYPVHASGSGPHAAMAPPLPRTAFSNGSTGQGFIPTKTATNIPFGMMVEDNSSSTSAHNQQYQHLNVGHHHEHHSSPTMPVCPFFLKGQCYSDPARCQHGHHVLEELPGSPPVHQQHHSHRGGFRPSSQTYVYPPHQQQQYHQAMAPAPIMGVAPVVHHQTQNPEPSTGFGCQTEQWNNAQQQHAPTHDTLALLPSQLPTGNWTNERRSGGVTPIYEQQPAPSAIITSKSYAESDHDSSETSSIDLNDTFTRDPWEAQQKRAVRRSGRNTPIVAAPTAIPQVNEGLTIDAAEVDLFTAWTVESTSPDNCSSVLDPRTIPGQSQSMWAFDQSTTTTVPAGGPSVPNPGLVTPNMSLGSSPILAPSMFLPTLMAHPVAPKPTLPPAPTHLSSVDEPHLHSVPPCLNSRRVSHGHATPAPEADMPAFHLPPPVTLESKKWEQEQMLASATATANDIPAVRSYLAAVGVPSVEGEDHSPPAVARQNSIPWLQTSSSASSGGRSPLEPSTIPSSTVQTPNHRHLTPGALNVEELETTLKSESSQIYNGGGSPFPTTPATPDGEEDGKFKVHRYRGPRHCRACRFHSKSLHAQVVLSRDLNERYKLDMFCKVCNLTFEKCVDDKDWHALWASHCDSRTHYNNAVSGEKKAVKPINVYDRTPSTLPPAANTTANVVAPATPDRQVYFGSNMEQPPTTRAPRRQSTTAATGATAAAPSMMLFDRPAKTSSSTHNANWSVVVKANDPTWTPTNHTTASRFQTRAVQKPVQAVQEKEEEEEVILFMPSTF